MRDIPLVLSYLVLVVLPVLKVSFNDVCLSNLLRGLYMILPQTSPRIHKQTQFRWTTPVRFLAPRERTPLPLSLLPFTIRSGPSPAPHYTDRARSRV
ncbi:hypothetical protein BD779DRAFT_1559267 [Infundibulicybe gibba]|nr:hypothetical protein BD779DRAFT_1559267 [Infundibulicybe gibba]